MNEYYPPKIECNGLYYLLKEDPEENGGLFYDGDEHPSDSTDYCNVTPAFFWQLMVVQCFSTYENTTSTYYKFYIPSSLPPGAYTGGNIVNIQDYYMFGRLIKTPVPLKFIPYKTLFCGTMCPPYDKKTTKKRDKSLLNKIDKGEKILEQQKKLKKKNQRIQESYKKKSVKQEKKEQRINNEENFDEQSSIAIIKTFIFALMCIIIYFAIYMTHKLFGFGNAVCLSLWAVCVASYFIVYKNPRYLVPVFIATSAGLQTLFNSPKLITGVFVCLCVYFMLTAFNNHTKLIYIALLIINFSIITAPFVVQNKLMGKPTLALSVRVPYLFIAAMETLYAFKHHPYIAEPDYSGLVNERALHRTWRILFGIIGFIFFPLTMFSASF